MLKLIAAFFSVMVLVRSICKLSSLNCEHVSLAGDVPRVDGQLAVARAFGDRSLKKHLSSEPHVAEEVIDENSDFLILASDGLWKVIKLIPIVHLDNCTRYLSSMSQRDQLCSNYMLYFGTRAYS